MSEYIKKEDAIKALTDCPVQYVVRICDVPSADVIEVVRCKDCKYQGTVDCPMDEQYEDDYCSYGEKKDEHIITK